MKVHRLRTPLEEGETRRLRAGEIVYLSGTIFTARDEAHLEMLEHGIEGFDPRGMVLYHCGPVARKENGEWKILVAGPTTSFRMEPLEPGFIARFGVRAIIGKGGMGPGTQEALQRHGTVYLAFTGGAGVLAAERLRKVHAVFLLEKLGMAEAVWVIEAEEFGPLVVAMDAHGNSLYDLVAQRSRSLMEAVVRDRAL
ncbi:MAG: FumA C-terminus/TtdB family hydratase beta subunit [Candidatus Thermoplasmatota archaeon]